MLRHRRARPSTGYSLRATLGLALALAAGCGPKAPLPSPKPDSQSAPTLPAPLGTKPLLAENTASSGIQFQHQAGGAPYFVPRSIGSGVALIDVDDDGRLDLYFVQNAGPGSGVTNRLFQQRADHTFIDISAESGLAVDGFGMGCAAGDVNNDGRVDLLLTEYGGIRLFLNESTPSGVRFVDVTQDANLENRSWGTSASFFDYDRDGWLDLVVANYLDYDPSRRCTDAGGREDFCGPQVFAPVVARLFRNLGGSATGGTSPGASPPARFEDVTIASGLAAKTGAGLGVVSADFTGDHWPDVFLANDGVPNTLWVNQHDGTFTEEAGRRGLAYNALGEAEADMGVGLGDVDGNGFFDLLVTHRATETHTLWLQEAQGEFIDHTPSSGITRTSWRGTGFGTALCDLDNDGDLDLPIVNGRVLRFANEHPATPADVEPFWRPYAQRDQLLVNDGTGRFHDVSESNPDFCLAAQRLAGTGVRRSGQRRPNGLGRYLDRRSRSLVSQSGGGDGALAPRAGRRPRPEARCLRSKDPASVGRSRHGARHQSGIQLPDQ